MEIPKYLDAQEERAKKLEIVKDKLLELTLYYVDLVTDDHPARIKENKERAKKVFDRIVARKADYDVFMSDFKNDWDLNFDDYDTDENSSI